MDTINLLDTAISAGNALIVLFPVLFFSLLLTLVSFYLYYYFTRNKDYKIAITFLVFSVFGGTIGVFIGASGSPIVSSILPPVITIVSGYLVFNGSKDASDDVKKLLPSGTLLFLLCLLFSAFYIKIWYSV